MEVTGPTSKQMNDVVLTVAVDPSSHGTIEGTHFKFNQSR
jgi:hypothetical protein